MLKKFVKVFPSILAAFVGTALAWLALFAFALVFALGVVVLAKVLWMVIA